MSALFKHKEFDHHRQVVFCNDDDTGLKAIIAIHDLQLGPSLGGCRMYPYASEDEALTDVLRLSRGMTLKNAVAGLPLGGGKCVIIADPNSPNKKARTGCHFPVDRSPTSVEGIYSSSPVHQTSSSRKLCRSTGDSATSVRWCS